MEVSLDNDNHEVMMMENTTKEEKMEKVKKIHQIMCHPKENALKQFFKDSNFNGEEVQRVIENVSRNCTVCLRHKRTPSRPKVGLPVVNDFNQCVALDLKIRQNKKPILYAVDTFSRLTRGIIIKNKEPANIVKGILDLWVLGKGIGPGIPDRFIVDNGGEFNNAEFRDLC